METVPPSAVHENEPHARTPNVRQSAKRRRTSPFFASVKFVGRENGFFWAVWSHASSAKGACLDAGFSDDVSSALRAIAEVPVVAGSRVALMDPCLAHATFAFIWLASPTVDPGARVPEDDAYEAARTRQWDPPEAPPRAERPQRRARVVRRQARPSRTVPPYWCSVLGTAYPCSLDEIRTAFRSRVLTAHPDHGGTTEAFVRLKAAYDDALKEVRV